ncbi:MAG TPA: hypothetical protein PLJ47_06610 [Candidatus Hydrogenedentes bacterium]|nr:hypothetical protein [Candidatus Hydrogenedentota bacterium]HRK34249.1 hypothetical protein [Candidatus Hydrogenedentota bacterium]
MLTFIKPLLRVSAVVSALALASAFVWYRTAEGNPRPDEREVEAVSEPLVMPGSKSTLTFREGNANRNASANGDATAPGRTYRLGPVITQDASNGEVNASQAGRRVFPGSKSMQIIPPAAVQEDQLTEGAVHESAE